MTFIPDTKFYARAAAAFADWYARAGRDLPWRRTSDPYAVLVSEMMLQRTQARRVAEYFPRWMERLPTLGALAAAAESDVLSLWQGLGYYSRARGLREAARKLIADGHETLVPDPAYLTTLPGIGPYTAGAVCCIAFNTPVPAVDGNVRRVFSRLLRLDGPPDKKENAALIERCVREILKRGEPRVLAQAFMELGATVCAPGALCRCAECPASAFCKAREAGEQAFLPASARAAPIKRRFGAALLIGGAEGIAVRRRAKGGLWAGFYEIPWLVGEENEDFAACFERLRRSLPFSGRCDDTRREETLRFTEWRVRVRLWRASQPDELPAGCEFVAPERVGPLPFPAGLKRLVLSCLRGGGAA